MLFLIRAQKFVPTNTKICSRDLFGQDRFLGNIKSTNLSIYNLRWQLNFYRIIRKKFSLIVSELTRSEF